jgi:hypothetical protein
MVSLWPGYDQFITCLWPGSDHFKTSLWPACYPHMHRLWLEYDQCASVWKVLNLLNMSRMSRTFRHHQSLHSVRTATLIQLWPAKWSGWVVWWSNHILYNMNMATSPSITFLWTNGMQRKKQFQFLCLACPTTIIYPDILFQELVKSRSDLYLNDVIPN